LELQPYGGGLEVVLDIVAKHLEAHTLLSAVHLFVAKLLRRVGPIKRLSDRRKDLFPMGYSIVAQKEPLDGTAP
jgi:hypothetical protein